MLSKLFTKGTKNTTTKTKLPKGHKVAALLSTMAPMAPVSSSTQNFVATPGTSALESARKLRLPSRQEMLRRDAKVYDFWNSNEEVLEKAWQEWNSYSEEAAALPKLDASVLNPKLKEAVERAWANPTPENEAAIKDLWTEVAPGVYAIQFLDLEQVAKLRQWFDATAEAGIPTRPPHGITLNRKGVMIDPRSVGHLAAPDFQTFYQKVLVEEYVRPLGRLFFPEHIRPEDDDASFAFSIQYQGAQGGDTHIRHHTDASTITFNINMDSQQTWTGSSLVFFPEGQGSHKVTWAPGIAVMHLGKTMHAALPIESGTRSNWVIWTMGSNRRRSYGGPSMFEDGSYPPEYQLTAKERWTKPEPKEGKVTYENRWSPF